MQLNFIHQKKEQKGPFFNEAYKNEEKHSLSRFSKINIFILYYIILRAGTLPNSCAYKRAHEKFT